MAALRIGLFSRHARIVAGAVLTLALIGATGRDIRGPAADSVFASSESPVVGVNSHVHWMSYNESDRAIVLDYLAAAGVRWIRIDIGWQSLEEAGRGLESAWYLQHVSATVDAARARGIHVLAMFWATPRWANGGAGPNVPPVHASDYADAAGRLARALAGRVEAWEVWNEPNQHEFWTGTAEEYAGLLRLTSAAIRSADPAALVVMGGTAYNDTGWLSDVYVAGVHGAFDVLATHPYLAPSDAPPETPDDGQIWTLAHVEAVRSLMVANGDSSIPIWFTEFGWSSHASPDEPPWRRGVSPNLQADYLVRTLRFVGSRYPYVDKVFWYDDRDRTDADIHNNNFGLLTVDLQPKPSYHALSTYLLGPPSSNGAGAFEGPPAAASPTANLPAVQGVPATAPGTAAPDVPATTSATPSLSASTSVSSTPTTSTTTTTDTRSMAGTVPTTPGTTVSSAASTTPPTSSGVPTARVPTTVRQSPAPGRSQSSTPPAPPFPGASTEPRDAVAVLLIGAAGIALTVRSWQRRTRHHAEERSQRTSACEWPPPVIPPPFSPA